ncbi:MAG: ribonuclease HII [Treponema sp.]|jgi:ribonuclease HII|nr:ribonuclease HII [Treponema sp.]
MICGIDEAGRGPLAGPVCAAAVILPQGFPQDCLGDSKKLSPHRREKARTLIFERAIVGIGWASATEIDALNILKASLLAMKRAFTVMVRVHPGLGTLKAIVDGLYVPDIPIPCCALVKADSLIPEVMAASILAKTARDRMMTHYARLYPEYGYERHKGYPTKEHVEKLARHGPSPIQRKTFKVRGQPGQEELTICR